MKTVSVLATNLKTGDVLDGMRIKAVHKYCRRVRRIGGVSIHDFTGVMVVMHHPKGYKLVTKDFGGGMQVKVKRPKKNMRSYGGYI